MDRRFETVFVNQRVIQDRRSRPTPFISSLKLGGRRRDFRRNGEERNKYVDRLSLRTIVLTFIIFALSTLDAIFTRVHLENGASELNPLMEHIIQTDFESALIIKSLGVGYMGCFLAAHQNFKVSFYGMHILTAIYSALLAYHLVSTCLLLVI